MTTTRKPAARRTATRKPVAEKIDAFEALRARAAGAPKPGANVNVAPLTLGPAEGFDPPIVVRWPSALSDKIGLDVASRRGDAVGFLSTLLGERNFVRVVAAFENEPDNEMLLVGLQLRLTDHFLGRGAGEAPGGTPAS
jgi:hypothetical protein